MFTGKTYNVPLLPFEKHLIELLGCTEDEYKQFVREAAVRGALRPAEYDLIPDVQGTWELGLAIASLVLGLASTAVSIFLTPKPRALSTVTQRQLASKTGTDRFSATSGFDTQAELADYQSPIPIIFGRYTGNSGGILASPQLVWSRAFSLGSQQAVKLLFVVGEQGLGEGLDRPELNGIFLGNTALDTIYDHNFAFYWKRNSNKFSRVKATNFAYGSRGTYSSGDIENNDDIFLCPTKKSLLDTGFSSAYSLTASSQFGVHSAIPNATNYRVNWRVISLPIVDGAERDPGAARIAERVKIAGDYGFDPKTKEGRDKILDAGQQGVGRNYGRRMGITHHNGIAATTPTEIKQVIPGDEITFTIAPGQLPKDIYWLVNNNESVTVDDINSEIEAGRRAADDMLQVGETVMIGRTTWVVTYRALPIWVPRARQSIKLKCVEIFGTGLGASIGIVNETMITRGVYNDDNGTTNARNGLGLNAGAGFYPLLRVALGNARNSRACDVTEFGIKSQVWQRAQGLCNFSSIPSPIDLKQAEQDKIQIESGTMTLYFKRTSVWTIWLRPAGTDNNGQEYAWAALGEQFCVTGETPQDQFNFIRIKHPECRQYEFKFIPKSGADVARHSPDDAVFWRLDAKQNKTLAGDYATAYGTFSVYAVGETVTAKAVKFNPEMLTNAVYSDGQKSQTIPNAIAIDTYIPDVEDNTAQAETVGFTDWLPDGVTAGRKGATMYELFGQASSYGLVKTVQRTVDIGQKRTITLSLTGVVNEYYPADHPYFPSYRAWNFQSITVLKSTGGFNTNQVFDMSIPVTAGNPMALPYGLTTCGIRFTVFSTTAGVPIGRESGFEYELLGNQEAYNLGFTKSVSFTVVGTSGNAASITASGVITTRPAESQANFPGQTKAWDVRYTINPKNTYGTWAINDTITYSKNVSTDNPFYETNKQVGIILRVVSLQTVDVPPGFLAERAFEENSQVNDLSVYNTLLQKSNENSPEHEIVYINESIANKTIPQYTKLTLCGLALKASRNFTSLNQLRFWLADGISVLRFGAGELNTIGPSNKFTDLVYYLLTDKTAGAGSVIAPELIKSEDFPNTTQFLDQNKLFYDGALDAPTNLRQFISDTAPYFLCNFVIADGKFSLVPAIPTDTSGSISTAPVKIKQLFTSGNIIEGTFTVDYLASEERKDFQAVMRYRQERKNQLPEEQTLVVRFAERSSVDTSIETFDMTRFCTTRNHALLVAKFFLSIRRHVTHSVKFSTTPYGLDLAPGDYIKVITQASPYSAANNGMIDSAGNITSATELTDGSYTIVYWTSTNEETKTATMTVAANKVIESTLWNSIFTISNATTSSNVYMIEQITLTEDNLVNIAATEFPCNSTDSSLIALDLVSDSGFITEG